uniref:2,3-bisphosphoglycerate-independent phosphoglycerate mutase n=1 Tax=Paulinella micropora TaxID=1928728 RepID=A0A385HZT5_9EUKA|nr:phosphoglyceromutase [Paulinella micropora]AXY63166.1 phosphoglyceromutase [Paulinella micropora]
MEPESATNRVSPLRANMKAFCQLPRIPLILAILDGWGYREDPNYNAIQHADTPIMDSLWYNYPHALIQASGTDVGLPANQMGNSEVGHLTIGSGRIIRQELVRIGNAIEKDCFGTNRILLDVAEKLRKNNKTLHLLGLCSDGGVHSHVNHLCGLLRWAKSQGLKKVSIHAITDGRDTSPESAKIFLNQVQQTIESYNIGEISTLCGRYWAMDRDNRWDRIEKAYRLICGTTQTYNIDPIEAIEKSYKAGITDEFLDPIRLKGEGLSDGDGLICFNFRPDRMRQLVTALISSDFDSFDRSRILDLDITTFTQYDASLPVNVVFPSDSLDGLLGQILADHGLRQYRIAETEKYPHVTYFMNGGIERPFFQEDRYLVPSPRVATYDEDPAMAADILTDVCISTIEKGIYSLIVINYANPDMVGHTGKMEATVEAITIVDKCVGQLKEVVERVGGSLIITADHGNAELMRDVDGQPWTSHTINPVPIIVIQSNKQKLLSKKTIISLRQQGSLADVAPTILEILGLPQPKLMTGHSLLKYADCLGR